MRNLKKLVALFVAIAMISTLMVPAFADSSFKYEEEAKDMYDLGLFLGESETEYVPNLGELLSRETGAVMLLRIFAQEDEALEMSEEDADAKLADFKDGATVANWAKKQVAYATDKGYIKGYPDGTFAPKEALNGKAYCSLVLQLLGYDGDFNYHTAATSLSEVGGLTSAEAAIFNSNDPINRDSLVGISYGALKATFKGSNETLIQRLVRLEKVDANLAKDKGLIDAVIKEVAELEDVLVKVGETANLPSTVEVTYDNDETGEVSVTWPTVDTSEVGEQEIEGIIAGTPLTAKVKVIVQPDELLVTSVKANNLKEVAVEFSAALDEDTVKTENIQIKDLNLDTSVELQEDGRTVILTVGKAGQSLDNQKNYTLKVTNVKDTTGMEIEETEKEFEAFDGTRPVAEEIKVTGPANLEITFNEPIKEGGEVEVKTGDSTIGTGDYQGYGSNTISIVVWDDMKDGETYEILVKDFKDYAGFINITKTFEVEYVKDTEPPVAEITKVDQKYVKVEFSKPVKGLHAENFYHTFTAWEAKGIYKDEAMTDEIKPEDSVSTAWVKFADNADGDRPLAEGTQRVGIRGKHDDVEVKDNWGNKFGDIEIDVTVTVDKENPKVTSITVEGEDELKITFNKAVKFSEENIEILDTDGNEIDGVDVTVTAKDKDSKEFSVKLGTDDLAGKSVVVKITDVEDKNLQPNKLSEYKETVEITDKTAPEVTKVSYDEKDKKVKDGSGNEVTIKVPNNLYFFFNEDVTNTALNKDNFKWRDDNRAFKSFEKEPRFIDGNSVVKIELSDDEIKGLADYGPFYIQSVQDKAGNTMGGQLYVGGAAHIKDDAPEVKEVEATAKDKLVVTFDQRLLEGNNIKPEAFKVNVDNEPIDIKSLSVSRNGDGNTVVTLNLKSEAIKANASNVELKVVGNEDLLNNIFEVAVAGVTILNTDIADKIAPSYNKDSIAVAGNEVTIKFDEKIKDATVSLYTFEVRNNEVTAFDVKDEDDVSVVTLTLEDSYAKGAKVRVSQKYDIEDDAGNKYRNTDTIEVEAGAATPVDPDPVTPVDPVVETAVSATSVESGDTLAVSVLSGTFKDSDTGESVPGNLAWTDATEVVTETAEFEWTFTPDDTDAYNVITGNVTVTVE